MIRFFYLITTMVVVLASVASATAQNATESFKKGKYFFDNGKFPEAYDYLFKAFQETPGNPNINFYLGRAAFEKGDYEAAVMAFERILIMNPGVARAKLELGRSFFNLKSYELAKQHFIEVLETKPPNRVRKNIENFIAAIDAAQKRHILNGFLSAGISWDNNARVAPSNEKIRTVIGDVTLTGSSATPLSDTIYTSTFVMNHIYRFRNDRTNWKSTGLAYSGTYQFADDLDQLLLSLVTGPEMKAGGGLWGINGLFNHLEVAWGRYLGSYGLGSYFSFAPKARLLINVGATGEKKIYYQSREKDAINLKINAGLDFILNPDRINMTLAGESEDADDDTNSYYRFAATLRYDRPLPFDIALFASVKYQKTDYRETESLFGVRRSDRLREFTVSLSKNLWRTADNRLILSAKVSNTYTESDSNIDLYRYDKNVIAAVLEFRF